MQKSYKQMLQDKQVTEKLLLSSLVTCEDIIRENAKWERIYEYRQPARALTYKADRLEWSGCRAKIREALQEKYDMDQIVAMLETHANKVAQRTVKKVVGLIDTGVYTLI